MKHQVLRLLITLCACFLLCPETLTAYNTATSSRITSATGAKVYYSFDHYANNSKVSRTFISGEMLKAAGTTSVWKSSAWDISKVASRLTSLLSLHTHSRSTTDKVREDMAKVMKMKEYEEYMNTDAGDIKVAVFCHRGRGKTIDELLVFRFRSNYCSRVIQMTGKLQPSDISAIIRKSF